MYAFWMMGVIMREAVYIAELKKEIRKKKQDQKKEKD
jgi:hypothetical protein